MDKFPETLTLAAVATDDCDDDKLLGWMLDELDTNTDDNEDADDRLEEIIEVDTEEEIVLLEELEPGSCFPPPEPPPQAPRDMRENNNAGFIMRLINMM